MSVGADAIDEEDARRGEHLGPEVGVAPRDQVAGVDDRRDPGVHQRLGDRLVEVEDVEDRHVAGAQSRQQRGDPAVHAGGSVDAGQHF